MAKFTEKQLISKLQELRQVKPSNDWVILTKKQILEKEKPGTGFSFISFIREIQRGERFVFQHKPAFASLLVLAILFGLFGFAQNSVPGDTLFSIKKITEKGQAVFISQEEQPKHDLEIANKRLDELAIIVENNQTENLASGINEAQESVLKAVENKIKPDEMEEIAEKIKVLGTKGTEMGKLNDIVILSESLEQVEYLINDLKTWTLTEDQQDILEKIEAEFKVGNFEKAVAAFDITQ